MYNLLNELDNLATAQLRQQQSRHARPMDRNTLGAGVPDYVIRQLASKTRDFCGKGVCDANDTNAVRELAATFLNKFPAAQRLDDQARSRALDLIADLVANMTEGFEFDSSQAPTLSPDEKENVILYAASLVHEHGIEAQEALGLALEDIPGMENADVTAIFNEDDIRRVNYVAQQAGQAGIGEGLNIENSNRFQIGEEVLLQLDKHKFENVFVEDCDWSASDNEWWYVVSDQNGDERSVSERVLHPV